jgi:hypothetical protein
VAATDGSSTSFENAQVAGFFVLDESTFHSTFVLFNGMHVEGTFYARHCTFLLGGIAFVGAHFADIFLNDSTFRNNEFIDFTRMEADFISFDKVQVDAPKAVAVQRMSFKLLSPVSLEQLRFLLLQYNAEFYTDLETSFRTHGYPDEADKVFIAKKRAERRNKCSNLMAGCESREHGRGVSFKTCLQGMERDFSIFSVGA